MFDVAEPLMNALGAARAALASHASATARAQTPYGGSRPDSEMAAVAERAIFSEAVMNAVHARLAEIKSVSHT
jgi:hypothetical protein